MPASIGLTRSELQEAVPESLPEGEFQSAKRLRLRSGSIDVGASDLDGPQTLREREQRTGPDSEHQSFRHDQRGRDRRRSETERR